MFKTLACYFGQLERQLASHELDYDAIKSEWVLQFALAPRKHLLLSCNDWDPALFHLAKTPIFYS